MEIIDMAKRKSGHGHEMTARMPKKVKAMKAKQPKASTRPVRVRRARKG